jgi:hypothetical protein
MGIRISKGPIVEVSNQMIMQWTSRVYLDQFSSYQLNFAWKTIKCASVDHVIVFSQAEVNRCWHKD